MTLAEIVAAAAANTEFIPGMSSNEMFYATSTDDRLTDVIATVADAVLDKADATHTHTPASIGAATADHTHSGYVPTTTYNELAADVAALETEVDGKAASSHTHAQADVTGLTTALAAKADLVDGKVPTSQLPSYVDDVLEYAALENFPTTGESGKIYVATGTNKVYRWSGSAYVEISATIALGETSATAYRGDRGKTAYDHSQNADVHVTTAQKAAWDAKQAALTFDTAPTANSTNPVTSGGIKTALDAKAASSHTHTASQVSGLATVATSGSYDDLADKPTIPAAYTHPANHPASMITGLATVATSGSYDDLSNKPTIPTIPSSLPANGGNADTVDGKHASDFAAASHTHDYAASDHTHTPAAIGAAAASHTHDYAASDHTHDYAASSHNHSASAINSGTLGSARLPTVPITKGGTGATTAAAALTALGAFPAAGGEISGETNFSGGLVRTKGQQTLFNSGTAITLSTNNLPTYIAGSAIYSSKTISVSSDERLKENIAPVDKASCVEFIDGIDVKTFNYIGDEQECMGVIAQDLQASDLAKFFVSTGEEGFLAVKAADLVFPLIAAVQELSKRVAELEGK